MNGRGGNVPSECETAVLSSDMREYVDTSDSVRGAAGGRVCACTV